MRLGYILYNEKRGLAKKIKIKNKNETELLDVGYC